MDPLDTRAFVARSRANLNANRRSIQQARRVLADVRVRAAAPPRHPSQAMDGATPPGSVRARRILAEAYELSEEAITLDAQQLAASRVPADEFLAALRGRLHWNAADAVIYMAALRSLLLDRHDATPWDDC